MNWFTKFFICAENTATIVKDNAFIIEFLKEAAKLSENSVDDSVVQLVQYLLEAKTED